MGILSKFTALYPSYFVVYFLKLISFYNSHLLLYYVQKLDIVWILVLVCYFWSANLAFLISRFLVRNFHWNHRTVNYLAFLTHFVKEHNRTTKIIFLSIFRSSCEHLLFWFINSFTYYLHVVYLALDDDKLKKNSLKKNLHWNFDHKYPPLPQNIKIMKWTTYDKPNLFLLNNLFSFSHERFTSITYNIGWVTCRTFQMLHTV